MLLVTSLLFGCTRVENSFQGQLSSRGVDTIEARMNQGSFRYTGDLEGEFLIEGTNWATGGSEDKAKEKAKGNTYAYGLNEDDPTILQLSATSEQRSSGTDFDVRGPFEMDVDVITTEHDVHLNLVDGNHVVTAFNIRGAGISGDVDLYATGDIDVEVFPFDNGLVRIASEGDVILALPFGLPYDLTANSSPDDGISATDLGFDTFHLNQGALTAFTDPGTIRVDVTAVNGSFTLWSID